MNELIEPHLRKIETNKVTITYNSDNEMMSIRNYRDETVFYGNYWDFSREPDSLKEFFNKLGLDTTIYQKVKNNIIYN